jgi:hypothetical protein
MVLLSGIEPPTLITNQLFNFRLFDCGLSRAIEQFCPMIDHDKQSSLASFEDFDSVIRWPLIAASSSMIEAAQIRLILIHNARTRH